MKDDATYGIVFSLNKGKDRSEEELYYLYEKDGGTDRKEIFKIKWGMGKFETGNLRELREFKNKLENLIVEN